MLRRDFFIRAGEITAGLVGIVKVAPVAVDPEAKPLATVLAPSGLVPTDRDVSLENLKLVYLHDRDGAHGYRGRLVCTSIETPEAPACQAARAYAFAMRYGDLSRPADERRLTLYCEGRGWTLTNVIVVNYAGRFDGARLVLHAPLELAFDKLSYETPKQAG